MRSGQQRIPFNRVGVRQSNHRYDSSDVEDDDDDGDDDESVRYPSATPYRTSNRRMIVCRNPDYETPENQQHRRPPSHLPRVSLRKLTAERLLSASGVTGPWRFLNVQERVAADDNVSVEQTTITDSDFLQHGDAENVPPRHESTPVKSRSRSPMKRQIFGSPSARSEAVAVLSPPPAKKAMETFLFEAAGSPSRHSATRPGGDVDKQPVSGLQRSMEPCDPPEDPLAAEQVVESFGQQEEGPPAEVDPGGDVFKVPKVPPGKKRAATEGGGGDNDDELLYESAKYLTNWVPCMKGRKFVIEGDVLDFDLKKHERWRTSEIVERKTTKLLMTKRGPYVLEGFMNAALAHQYSAPEFVVRKFKKGIPDNWQNIVQVWREWNKEQKILQGYNSDSTVGSNVTACSKRMTSKAVEEEEEEAGDKERPAAAAASRSDEAAAKEPEKETVANNSSRSLRSRTVSSYIVPDRKHADEVDNPSRGKGDHRPSPSASSVGWPGRGRPEDVAEKKNSNGAGATSAFKKKKKKGDLPSTDEEEEEEGARMDLLQAAEQRKNTEASKDDGKRREKQTSVLSNGEMSSSKKKDEDAAEHEQMDEEEVVVLSAGRGPGRQLPSKTAASTRVETRGRKQQQQQQPPPPPSGKNLRPRPKNSGETLSGRQQRRHPPPSRTRKIISSSEESTEGEEDSPLARLLTKRLAAKKQQPKPSKRTKPKEKYLRCEFTDSDDSDSDEPSPGKKAKVQAVKQKLASEKNKLGKGGENKGNAVVRNPKTIRDVRENNAAMRRLNAGHEDDIFRFHHGAASAVPPGTKKKLFGAKGIAEELFNSDSERDFSMASAKTPIGRYLNDDDDATTIPSTTIDGNNDEDGNYQEDAFVHRKVKESKRLLRKDNNKKKLPHVAESESGRRRRHHDRHRRESEAKKLSRPISRYLNEEEEDDEEEEMEDYFSSCEEAGSLTNPPAALVDMLKSYKSNRRR